MKARVKETGEIVEVVLNGIFYDRTDNKERYYHHELDFNDTIDYWTRLEHRYAGMAMQGLLNNNLLSSILLKTGTTHEDYINEVVNVADEYAKALITKMKNV